MSLFIQSGDNVPIGAGAGIISLRTGSALVRTARNELGEIAIAASYREPNSTEFFEAVWLHDFETKAWVYLFGEGDAWDGSPVPSTEDAYYFDDRGGTSGETFGLADDGTLGVHMHFTPSNDGMYAIQVIHVGDADEDGDIDLVDFGTFQICFTGPSGTASEQCGGTFDFDGDNDIDLSDFGEFQLSFTGPQ